MRFGARVSKKRAHNVPGVFVWPVGLLMRASQLSSNSVEIGGDIAQ